MRIVQVTTEFAPLAKAGGLGDVMVGLSRELIRQGAEVDILLPKYDFISPRSLKNLKHELDFTSPEWEHQISNTMWSAEAENCPLHLLETRHPKDYFNRGKIYGCEDDVLRFLFFARACLEYLKTQPPIDILHLHDWHAAALAPLIREVYPIQVKSIVLSIHNLKYQGHCSVYDLEAIGLKKEHTAKLRFQSHFNLLKGAIAYADAIIPVSPSYAQEILTHDYGFGLDEDLRKQKGKITGILNGIDLNQWDPFLDPALTTHYSAVEPTPKILAAKRSNRLSLALRFKLSSDCLWFGAITRLVPQKGPQLIESALREAVKQQSVFALLGTSPIPDIQRHFEALKKEFANHPQVFIHLDHDEQLAHEFYAALDFLVVPSFFEPCGLTQLIAMHYGTIPIVRSTGGLKDSVFDCQDLHIPVGKQNGFTFLQPTPEALLSTIRRAIAQSRTNPSAHQLLIKHGMTSDFSWKKPTEQYLSIYKKLIQK